MVFEFFIVFLTANRTLSLHSLSLGLSTCTMSVSPLCSSVGSANISLALYSVDDDSNLPTGSALATAAHLISTNRTHLPLNLSGTELDNFSFQPSTKYALAVTILPGGIPVLSCFPRANCNPYDALHAFKPCMGMSGGSPSLLCSNEAPF